MSENELPEVPEVEGETVEEVAAELGVPVENVEEVKAKLGLKDTEEVIEAVKAIITFAGKVFEDKKVSVADLGHFINFATDGVPKIVAAVEGIDNIDDEFKDLDQEEVVKLAAIGYGVLMAAKDAFKK
jgi:hypothetical protein